MKIKEEIIIDEQSVGMFKTDKENVLYFKGQRGWGSLHIIQEDLIKQNTPNYGYGYDYLENIKFVYADIYDLLVNGVLCGNVHSYRVSKRSIIKL